MNIQLIAVEIGDALKYDTSINEITRIASAILPFQHDHFPNDAITSQRAKLIYDWIMGLGRYRCTPAERSDLLTTFLLRLVPEGEVLERVLKIL
jgi:hypothetical protein